SGDVRGAAPLASSLVRGCGIRCCSHAYADDKYPAKGSSDHVEGELKHTPARLDLKMHICLGIRGRKGSTEVLDISGSYTGHLALSARSPRPAEAGCDRSRWH